MFSLSQNQLIMTLVPHTSSFSLVIYVTYFMVLDIVTETSDKDIMLRVKPKFIYLLLPVGFC